ncbi:hypothetical protein [Stappia indica]|uniref:hypothetical protein n=1 Tax=Stappia indica TaxID=538381 RepID=UPI001CD35F75|nr:hypothetical protein [Stappia indica]MCA1298040.1 hypothetical protein [Stappia indica]
MPVYTIETPSGRRLKIEADTPEIAMQGAQEWSAANEGDKQPGKRTVGALEASNRGVEQGLTFGFGDELMAGAMAPVEAVVGGLQGKGFGLGDAYNRNLERERAMLQQAREDSPIASAIGEIGGGLMTGGGLAKSGATLIGRTAGKGLATRAGAGMLEGAGYGAAYGFGSGEGGAGERLKSAGQGAAVGGAVGGAIPVVGAAAKKVLSPVARKIGNRFNPRGAEQQRGIDRVLKEAKGAGLTPDDLVQGVRDGRTVGQMDPNLSDLTRAVKRQPGDHGGMVDKALDAGYSANNQAAKQAISDGLGDQNFYMWRDMFAKSKSKGAQKAYDAAFKRNWGKNGPPFELDSIVKSGRIPAEALRSAQRIAQAEGRPFGKQLVASIDDASGAVTFSRLPSLEEAELIRRGLSSATSKAFRTGDGSVGAAYRGLEREMRGVLDEASPWLKAVRKAYATASQIQEAADEGLKLLNKSADEVEFIVSNASKPEREAMRKGLASALKHDIERGQINRDKVRNIFGSERNRRVLETMWPDKKGFETFRKQMENAAEFSAFRQNVQGNSRTQQDLADAGAMGGGLGSAARNVVMTGNLRGAAVDALMTIIGRTVNPAKGMPPETLKRMAQILVEKNPQEVQRLLTQVDRNGRISGDLLVKLLERAQASPELQRNLTVGLVTQQ